MRSARFITPPLNIKTPLLPYILLKVCVHPVLCIKYLETALATVDILSLMVEDRPLTLFTTAFTHFFHLPSLLLYY
jgi:hypothetical protein